MPTAIRFNIKLHTEQWKDNRNLNFSEEKKILSFVNMNFVFCVRGKWAMSEKCDFFSFEFLGLFDTGTWVQPIFMIPWIMSDRMNVINWLRCNRAHFDVLSIETYLTTSVNGLNSIIFFERVRIHHLLRMSFYGRDGYEVLWRSGWIREQLGLDPESAPNFDCRSPRWTDSIRAQPSSLGLTLRNTRVTSPFN